MTTGGKWIMYKKNIFIKSSEVEAPYNFEFHLEHYVIYPWLVENKNSVRILRLKSEKVVKVEISFTGTVNKPSFKFIVTSSKKLTRGEVEEIKDTISWCLGFKEKVKPFYDKICKKDPVLKVASEGMRGVRSGGDPVVFEAIIGVVVAQNVQFKRIYTMLKNLCQRFGDKLKIGSKVYYAFPTPKQLAKAPLKAIRACKVGYRDKYIKGIAQTIVKNKIDLEALKKISDDKKIREELMKLPGVGPYTADLVLHIGFRRQVFHLDLFSREAMQIFYFNGKEVSDKKIMDYIDKHWGDHKSLGALFLTTNTDEWAKKLGKKFRLKSGAKIN